MSSKVAYNSQSQSPSEEREDIVTLMHPDLHCSFLAMSNGVRNGVGIAFPGFAFAPLTPGLCPTCRTAPQRSFPNIFHRHVPFLSMSRNMSCKDIFSFCSSAARHGPSSLSNGKTKTRSQRCSLLFRTTRNIGIWNRIVLQSSTLPFNGGQYLF